jgi:hypothetical protein
VRVEWSEDIRQHPSHRVDVGIVGKQGRDDEFRRGERAGYPMWSSSIEGLQLLYNNTLAMQPATGYPDALEDALEARAQRLESSDIPQLKEDFRLLHSTFGGLFTVLQRKGLVQEDPYKNDQRISEIEPPSDDSFLESEKDQMMSVRLSQFDSMLDFLNNYVQFRVDTLDLKQIRNLVKLTSYIKWDQLSESSNSPTTRTLAEHVSKLRGDADPLSTSLVKDSVEQLARRSKSIMKGLKLLADYHKERFKLALRRDAYPQVPIEGEQALKAPDETIRKLKKAFASAHSGEPFFPDLAREALEEDFGPNGEERRRQVLKRLRPEEEQAQKQSTRDPFKPMLLDAVRVLAGASRSLQSAQQKINDNLHVLDSRKLPFGERIRRFFERVASRDKPRPHMFELEYFDDATSASQTEQISADEFAAQLGKKSRVYGGVLNKVSQTARKLQAASEEQLFEFLNKQMEELAVVQRRLQSLETALRAEFPREQRSQLRSLQAEVDGLKDVLSRTGKKRREYVARKDEHEQMKKLGIENG